MTKRTWGAALGLTWATAGWGLPIVQNGDFSQPLSVGWVVDHEPDVDQTYAQQPVEVHTERRTGISSDGVPDNPYVVFDSSADPGNPALPSGGVDTYAALRQNLLLGTHAYSLEFRLTDVGDASHVNDNYAGMLLDNIRLETVAGTDYVVFDWFALAHKDTERNDFFTVSLGGTELYRFSYTDTRIPTSGSTGGGGQSFGPFSYGTGWINNQRVPFTVSGGGDPEPPPVPEPATWGVMVLGLAALARRRRRRQG